MAVTIKSHKEIELMRHAGHLLSEVFASMRDMIRPGVSTMSINRKCESVIEKMGCTPNFLHYNGYPASVCTSVNEAVVHGIPRDDYILEEGDIISLDCGLIYQGYHSDCARTYPVGEISKEKEQLIKVTRQSFYQGLEFARAGHHLHEISAAIGTYAESFGYGVVRDLVGHGIGTALHEDPEIPNFSCKSRGIMLREGMTLAIEPMINAGTYEVEWLGDDWTVVTADNKPSAHYENTILITNEAPEILTATIR